jgi:glycosyltransferase involved in cell wall biosynthesis
VIRRYGRAALHASHGCFTLAGIPDLNSSTSASPRISVIVPVRDGGPTLGRALDAILSNDRHLYELIVVDDGSTDDTREIAAAAGAKVVQNPRSRGPAAARNTGVEHARGDIVLFVDADVEVQPTTIERILARFDANPDLAALFGSYDDEPAADNFVSQYKNLLHHFIHQTAEARSGSFWAGCGAVRRRVFLAVGGFHERLYQRPATEDIELGLRLWNGGFMVQLAADIQVKHLKAWTGYSMVKSDIVDRAYPWSKLLLEQRSLPNDLNLRWSHRLSAVLVALLAVTLTFLALGHRRFYFVPATPVAAVTAVLLFLPIIPLNREFYAFLIRTRGWLFVARAIPLHVFYYFYSGVTFVAAWTWHHVPGQHLWAGRGPSSDG